MFDVHARGNHLTRITCNPMQQDATLAWHMRCEFVTRVRAFSTMVQVNHAEFWGWYTFSLHSTCTH